MQSKLSINSPSRNKDAYLTFNDFPGEPSEDFALQYFYHYSINFPKYSISKTIRRTDIIASKITVTLKGVYWPISKLHSILAVADLLAHNNKSQFVTAVKFHYRVLQLTAVFLTIWHLWGNIYFAGDGHISNVDSLATNNSIWPKTELGIIILHKFIWIFKLLSMPLNFIHKFILQINAILKK